MVRPTSGNLPGPKTISPTIKITMNSPAPIPNMLIAPKIFRADYIMRVACYSNIFQEYFSAAATDDDQHDIDTTKAPAFTQGLLLNIL